MLKTANSNEPLTQKERDKLIKKAEKAYEKFMDALNIDWRNDPHSLGTPHRVAKMWINEIASGCYTPAPNIRDFENITN